MDRANAARSTSRTSRYWIARRDVDPEARAALRRVRRAPARARASRTSAADRAGSPRRSRTRAQRWSRSTSRAAMLRAARGNAPARRRCAATSRDLPFARESLAGAWARTRYIHLPFAQLAGALAELHRALRPGAASCCRCSSARGAARDGFARAARSRTSGALGGRALHARCRAEFARDLLDGRGLPRDRRSNATSASGSRATRARTLADSLRPGLRAAGRRAESVADRRGDRRPVRRREQPLLARRAARGLDRARARRRRRAAPRDRLHRSRQAHHARARAQLASAASTVPAPRASRGWCARSGRAPSCSSGSTASAAPSIRARGPVAVRDGFAGRPAYLAPSTSGRNAAVSLAALVRHFRRARALAQ